MSEKASNNRLILLAGILAALGVSWVVLFWPTLHSLHLRWSNSDEPYSQSYLVLILIVYLIGFRIHSCRNLLIKPNLPVLVTLAIPAVLLWAIGYLSYTQIVSQLALPLILLLWIYGIFGLQLARMVAAPLALFYFTVPFWGIIGTLLRNLTVGFVDNLLEFTGIPSYVDGYYIHLPAGIVEVAGGCSGQNYFISGLIIASFYAMRYLHDFYSKLFCIVLMGILAIVANWIRVFSLVLIGYYSDMTHGLMHEHSNFGWLVFVLVLIPYIFFIQKFERATRQKAGAVKDGSLDAQKAIEGVKNNQFFGIFVVTIVFSYGLTHAVYNVEASGEQLTAVLSIHGDEGSRETTGIRFLPDYKGYDSVQVWVDNMAVYREEIVLLAYYTQAQGKELIHESNTMTKEASHSTRVGVAELADGQSIAFEKTKINNESAIIFWVYSVANRYTVSGIQAKILQVYAKFFPPTVAGLVTFTVYCGESCDYINIEETAAGFNEKLMSSVWVMDE